MAVQLQGIPRLPSFTDYWGAPPSQPTNPAIVVPEPDDRGSLPVPIAKDTHDAIKLYVILTLVIAVGILLAQWLDREL